MHCILIDLRGVLICVEAMHKSWTVCDEDLPTTTPKRYVCLNWCWPFSFLFLFLVLFCSMEERNLDGTFQVVYHALLAKNRARHLMQSCVCVCVLTRRRRTSWQSTHISYHRRYMQVNRSFSERNARREQYWTVAQSMLYQRLVHE